MTLHRMLAAHNDTALEALASKGLVRRAGRDLVAGRAEVRERSEERAIVVADGQEVTVDSRGPVHAECACPASGVCRHVLLAVMVLRDKVPASGEVSAADSAGASTAAEDLCALSQAAIEKFAGADWTKACALVASEDAVVQNERPPNLIVELAELGITVTFIAGQGLKGAAYKGPKTRARTLITACALLVRQRRGVALEAPVGAASGASLDAQFLERASSTVAAGVSAVLPGRSAIAADLFLDLAISTRVEALPRLSAELRGLANQAKLATKRDVAFEPDSFLKAAGRTYALLQALKESPDDALLRGAIKRDFQPADGLELWMLGAARWRSDTGARGMTAYAYSSQSGRWYSVSDGRPAGTDPGFAPGASYRAALWGAGTLDGLIGRALRLPAPMIAPDGAIALRLERNGTPLDAPPTVERLVDSGAAHRSWPDLYRDLRTRFGTGLHRRQVPLPALVVPHGFSGFGFRDLDQVYEWHAVDRAGNELVLSIPGTEHDLADELHRMRGRLQALLLEATLGPFGLSFRPISVCGKVKRETRIWNLDFDELPHRRERRGLVGALVDRLTRHTRPRLVRPDALQGIVSGTLDVALAALGRTGPEKMDGLLTRCEAAGLETLATALQSLRSSPDVETALKTAFLAAEIESVLAFEAGPGQC